MINREREYAELKNSMFPNSRLMDIWTPPSGQISITGPVWCEGICGTQKQHVPEQQTDGYMDASKRPDIHHRTCVV